MPVLYGLLGLIAISSNAAVSGPFQFLAPVLGVGGGFSSSERLPVNTDPAEQGLVIIFCTSMINGQIPALSAMHCLRERELTLPSTGYLPSCPKFILKDSGIGLDLQSQ